MELWPFKVIDVQVPYQASVTQLDFAARCRFCPNMSKTSVSIIVYIHVEAPQSTISIGSPTEENFSYSQAGLLGG